MRLQSTLAETRLTAVSDGNVIIYYQARREHTPTHKASIHVDSITTKDQVSIASAPSRFIVAVLPLVC